MGEYDDFQTPAWQEPQEYDPAGYPDTDVDTYIDYAKEEALKKTNKEKYEEVTKQLREICEMEDMKDVVAAPEYDVSHKPRTWQEKSFLEKVVKEWVNKKSPLYLTEEVFTDEEKRAANALIKAKLIIMNLLPYVPWKKPSNTININGTTTTLVEQNVQHFEYSFVPAEDAVAEVVADKL